MKVEFLFNGKRRSEEVAPEDAALHYLGDEYAQRGSCGNGSCMQCSVLLNGRVVNSCALPAYRLDGAEIVSHEGLGNDPLHRDILRAFEKVGLNRCRETFPGLVLLAYQLLSDTPIPGDAELHEYSRHLSTRCVSREEFERATRLAGRVHKRKRHE
jgi:aerobic-type carbon monoxide dehydrogenase small subunit (CoxS/CutS family)